MDSVQNKNSQKEGNSLLIQEAKDDTMRFLKEQLVRLEQVKRMSSRTIFAHEKSLINALFRHQSGNHRRANIGDSGDAFRPVAYFLCHVARWAFAETFF